MCGGGGGAIVVAAMPGLGREAVLAVGPRDSRPGTIGPGLTPGGRVVFVYPYPGRAPRGDCACVVIAGPIEGTAQGAAVACQVNGAEVAAGGEECCC